ncbi:M-phase inducer phosphatase [Monosporozyma unispora]|nr:cell division cycle- protein [Kazachstania unispora]
MGIFTDNPFNTPLSREISELSDFNKTDDETIKFGIFSKTIQEDSLQRTDILDDDNDTLQLPLFPPPTVMDTMSHVGLRRSKSCRQTHKHHHRKNTNDSIISLPTRPHKLHSRKNSSISSIKTLIPTRYRLNFESQLSHTGIKTHSDSHDLFPRINVDTLRNIICNGVLEPWYESYTIIDNRFDYEFEGGHIKNALNICSSDELETKLLNGDYEYTKPTLLIFHCEFSSHRGPTLASHLRNCDRIINQDNYPKLYYPDIVILDGGYKSFYDKFPMLCYPQNYVTMNSSENLLRCEKELDKFRSNSKRMISKTNLSPIEPHFKFDAPPKLSFLTKSISDTASSDDNVSSIGSSCTSVNKMLLMNELDSNDYDSLDNRDDENEEVYKYIETTIPTTSNRLCFNNHND